MTFVRLYNYHDLEVGQSVLMETPDTATDRRIRRAVSVYGTRHDKHFSCRREGDALRIVRNR